MVSGCDRCPDGARAGGGQSRNTGRAHVHRRARCPVGLRVPRHRAGDRSEAARCFRTATSGSGWSRATARVKSVGSTSVCGTACRPDRPEATDLSEHAALRGGLLRDAVAGVLEEHQPWHDLHGLHEPEPDVRHRQGDQLQGRAVEQDQSVRCPRVRSGRAWSRIGGENKGTYLELGVGPTLPLKKATLSIPVKLGMSLNNYYELNGDGQHVRLLRCRRPHHAAAVGHHPARSDRGTSTAESISSRSATRRSRSTRAIPARWSG